MMTQQSFSSKKHSGGFTMIELLVVTTIIIMLSAVGIVSFRQAGISARNGKRKADLETVRQALVLYRTDNGVYPAATGLTSTNFDTLVSTTIADYISTVDVTDPKGSGDATYFYAYTSDGVTFTVQAALEPDGDPFTLTNP